MICRNDNVINILNHFFETKNLEELKTMYQFEKDTHIPVYIFEKDFVNRVETKQITKDGIHIIIGRRKWTT